MRDSIVPLLGCGFAMLAIYCIDMFIVPVHHAAATRDGILLLEAIVLGLLFSAAVWDKAMHMRSMVRSHGLHENTQELFTWNEIAKIFACLAASMLIFVAVVQALELKSIKGGHGGHTEVPVADALPDVHSAH